MTVPLPSVSSVRVFTFTEYDAVRSERSGMYDESMLLVSKNISGDGLSRMSIEPCISSTSDRTLRKQHRDTRVQGNKQRGVPY